ncbi:MAG: MATE family efflux transporter [Parachlamydiaceae bacterium]|nr:MATE family efflux transporter [Parachlamydiaceae bacterium]
MFSSAFCNQLLNLWKLALPLMLSSLSGMAMVFIDRLILARHSLEAHNIAVEATNVGWAFLAAISALAGISQVFVSQNAGAGTYKNIGKPVWQMIWLSLASTIIFFAISIKCPEWIFGSEESCALKRSYFTYMIYFAPLHGLFAALTGFYIGLNRPIIPTCLVIGGNLINALLCYPLVFGVEGYIDSYGAMGAIIATCAAVTVQAVFLLCGFLSQRNRIEYGTDQWKINIPTLRKAITIGFPNAFFNILEITGWALFYKMMSSLSEDHLTVAGIVQNILILSFFFNEGMSRAIIAQAGHAIGAQQLDKIPQILKAGFFSVTIFCIILGFCLFCGYDSLIGLFLKNMSEEQANTIYYALVFGCVNAVIYKYFEGIRMIVAGALIAAADTVFLLTAGVACVWLGMVIPVYFFVYKTGGSIEKALTICSLYTLVAAIVYLWRFYSKAWMRSAQLVDHDTKNFESQNFNLENEIKC